MEEKIRNLVDKVKEISVKNGASQVLLFGSYAKGTERLGSDIDIVIKGTNNFDLIKQEVDDINTSETIDLLDYDKIKNKLLLSDIDKYGKVI